MFGARYEKDALKMLSKLKYALPKEYNHIYLIILIIMKKGINALKINLQHLML